MKKNERLIARIQELATSGISKREAGKILYEEGYAKSIEDGRARIRYYTGQFGVKSKDKCSTIIDWKTGIPEPDPPDFQIVEMPSAYTKILVLTDIHVPFHDKDALTIALEAAKDCDAIIFQEVFDFYQLSRFDKTSFVSVAHEQDNWNRLMDHVRTITEVPIYYQEGNHDERYQVFIYKQAAALRELQGMEFQTIFGFNDYDVRPLPGRCIIKIRNQYLGHGHETGMRSGGVFPARTLYLKVRDNYTVGHFHKTTQYSSRNSLTGKITTTNTLGCLCDLNPYYMRINDWNHGFGIFHVGKETARLENIRI